ncbi:MAG TPA: bifunctional glutamate N-acetyltransferase/amino-acid acetyltransferase ArgJ [Methylomirabilota bacterium]|jgi:glutamate N-acetyltransferase/amino-acid N-acetyltransferase|nr:bifunctional glutamate N-acetyltransferase/amino-acid acetyltransferase ArgJ [Methylomirabilota bacterium]
MRVRVEKRPVIVPGFRFAGVACGIKPSGKKDVALIVSEVPGTAAAAFTTNNAPGAPVVLGRERLKAGRLQAIVVNSGIANVATGQAGLRLAKETCAVVGQALGIDETLVLPSSTGKIGVLPPWDKLRPGVLAACQALSPRGFWQALAGMMTTDAFPKAATRQVEIGGKTVTIAGMAKGAGMINPNMATMLCYVLTDARVERAALRKALSSALVDTFNAVSVDGDTSTSDTVVLLANGMADNREIRSSGRDFLTFQNTVEEILRDLSRLVVKDGEGATRVVDIFVRGARHAADARKVARAVAYSPLVKTAFYGGDPNWGRIVCAVGYSGAALNLDRLDIFIGDVPIGRNGVSTGVRHEKQAAAVMRAPEFSLTIDLHLGGGAAHVITSDLTVGYVRFNSSYST